MAEDTNQPTDKEVKEFQSLATHEERCAYFHDHPALATVFRSIHFPKPNSETQD